MRVYASREGAAAGSRQCRSRAGLFRHLGAGVRADGPRNLYHGPGFHALCRKLRGRAAPPPGLSPQTTPPTPPGLRKALANVPARVELKFQAPHAIDAKLPL